VILPVEAVNDKVGAKEKERFPVQAIPATGSHTPLTLAWLPVEMATIIIYNHHWRAAKTVVKNQERRVRAYKWLSFCAGQCGSGRHTFIVLHEAKAVAYA
jgi:hypothetical protein